MLTEKETQFILSHRTDDVHELLLHGCKDADIDIRKVAVQISGWQQARKKLPLWASTDGILFPEHLPLEQCSSEATARYKGSLLSSLSGKMAHHTEEDDATGRREVKFTDLTGGFGVDATMIARALDGCRLTFVEKNESLCQLGRHNLPLLGVRDADVRCADCEQWIEQMPSQDVVFIDPARRDTHGRKTVAIGDCTPDICRLQDKLTRKARLVAVKLSPMLDLTEAVRQLVGLREIHVVGVEGECKELLLVLAREDIDVGKGPLVCCADIRGDHTDRFCFTYEEEMASPVTYAACVSRYLYEPNACVMKAGGFRSVAVRHGVEKLGANSHLYTSETLIDTFPGRRFEVDEVIPFNKSGIKHAKSILHTANITARNFPLTVAEIRKRLKINEGGSNYLFATTLHDSSLVLILCRKTGSLYGKGNSNGTGIWHQDRQRDTLLGVL